MSTTTSQIPLKQEPLKQEPLKQIPSNPDFFFLEGQASTRKERKKFTPSEKQRKVLLLGYETNFSFTSAHLLRIGVSVEEWYGWFESYEFRGWWSRQAGGYFSSKLPVVWGTMLDCITLPEHAGRASRIAAVCKVYLQRFDKNFAPRAKVDVETRDTLRLEFVKAVPRDISPNVSTPSGLEDLLSRSIRPQEEIRHLPAPIETSARIVPRNGSPIDLSPTSPLPGGEGEEVPFKDQVVYQEASSKERERMRLLGEVEKARIDVSAEIVAKEARKLLLRDKTLRIKVPRREWLATQTGTI